MDEYHMAARVLIVEGSYASVGWVWGRPRLGWINGVWMWPLATEKSQWRLHDNDWKIGESGEPWCIFKWLSFTRPVLLGPVFFRTALPCSGGYHLEWGGMLLHDAVEITSKNGTTTENQGAGVKYMGKGVYVRWLCVCFLTCQFGMTTPPWWREKVMVYYYF